MSSFSDDFMEYLKIYNPTAYDKANSEGVKTEELTEIYNANAAKFEIWESIPVTIRNRYPGMPVSHLRQIRLRVRRWISPPHGQPTRSFPPA